MGSDIRQVLGDNPDLPVIVVAEQFGSDYDCVYLDRLSARANWLLRPEDATLYGCCGLDDEKVYDDHDDAAEDMADCLYYGWEAHAQLYGLDRMTTTLGEYCGCDIVAMADRLANKVIAEQPWKKCVVITAYA